LVGRGGWHFQKKVLHVILLLLTVFGSKLSSLSGKAKLLEGAHGKFAVGPANKNKKNYVNISLAVNIHKFNHSTVSVGLLQSHLFFIVSCLIVNFESCKYLPYLPKADSTTYTRFMQA